MDDSVRIHSLSSSCHVVIASGKAYVLVDSVTSSKRGIQGVFLISSPFCSTRLYLILAKLRAYQDSQSTRHLDDIASVIRLQGRRLPAAELELTAARLGLLGVWRALWAANRTA